MLKKNIFYFTLLIFSMSAFASPKFLVQHKRSPKNFSEIQLTNQTSKALLCFVAIDGHKIFFSLQPQQPSKWYKATDQRFNYTNFSTWCDYLSSHPEYNPKK